MAEEQGTGKHPHKSASDPKEHQEGAKATKSESSTEHSTGSHKAESHTTEHADGQGTGKHPHKKASDPQEHHEGAKK